MSYRIKTTGETYRNQAFTGTVDLFGDRNTFDHCQFDGANDLYAVRAAGGGKQNRFINGCTVTGGKKGVLLQSMLWKDFIFQDIGSDGAFVFGEGESALIGTLKPNERTSTSIIRGLGSDPGAHADGLQIPGTMSSTGVPQRQGNIFVKGVHFDLPHKQAEEEGRTGTNSCVFIESDFGSLSRLSVVGCVLDGGNYPVYLLEQSEPLLVESVRLQANIILSYRFGPYATNTSLSLETFKAHNNLKHAYQAR